MALIGILASHRTKNGTFVDYVCTAKSHRRKGVARLLMSSLAAERIFLITIPLSKQFAFYARIGFEETTVCPYEAGNGEICLSGRLPPAAASAVEVFDSENLPWGQVQEMLHASGLRSQGIRRFLRPNDPNMQYRVVFADKLPMAPRKTERVVVQRR